MFNDLRNLVDSIEDTFRGLVDQAIFSEEGVSAFERGQAAALKQMRAQLIEILEKQSKEVISGN